MSLKPKPPLYFDVQSFFQAIQWIFWVSPLYPHKNLWIRDSISLHKDFGNIKQPMVLEELLLSEFLYLIVIRVFPFILASYAKSSP